MLWQLMLIINIEGKWESLYLFYSICHIFYFQHCRNKKSYVLFFLLSLCSLIAIITLIWKGWDHESSLQKESKSLLNCPADLMQLSHLLPSKDEGGWRAPLHCSTLTTRLLSFIIFNNILLNIYLRFIAMQCKAFSLRCCQ